MFWRNKIVFVLLLFVSVFGYVVFSDAVNTSYTEFYFVSGGNNYTTLSVNLTGGETGNVYFYLENKSDAGINMNISFVDSEVINFSSTGVRVCKSENEKDKFGNYVSMSDDTFILSAGANTSETLDLLFPAWYSGVYLGCVVYYPTVTEDDDHLNTVARKAIFLDVDVVPTNAIFGIKVYPSNRYDPGYRGNEGKLLFYQSGNTGIVLYSGYLTTNTNGTGSYIEDIPTGIYDVVYKGQSHLGSYLSGVVITGGQEISLDFTIGSNLYYTKTEGSDQAQIAGDMKNALGEYDGEINVGDITSLITSVDYYGAAVDQWNINNLNGDTLVTSADLSVIIDNFNQRGVYYLSDPDFGGFSW